MGEAMEELDEPKSTIHWWTTYFNLCIRGDSEKKKPLKFTESEMNKLRFIQKRSEEGFNLAMIKEFLDSPSAGKRKLDKIITELKDI